MRIRSFLTAVALLASTVFAIEIVCAFVPTTSTSLLALIHGLVVSIYT